jgi:hypothetical protein
MGPMKTTLEIPDTLFRQAKSKAAERGQTLKEFVSEALHEKLAPRKGSAPPSEPEWMDGFGKLRRLHKETKRVQETIREAFETVEPEDRA